MKMALMLLGVFGASVANAANPWRILPLGDSITYGCGYEASPPNWYAVCDKGSGSYRAGLWAALNSSGANTVFVGRQSAGPAWLPLDQRHHEGHGGWTATQLRTIVNATLKATTPDAILLLVGTNDIGQGHSLATMVSDMAGLLSDLRTGAPAAKIFVGTVRPPPPHTHTHITPFMLKLRHLTLQVLNMVNSENPKWSPAVAAFNAELGPLAHAVGGVLVDLHNKTGLCSPDDDKSTQRLCSECNGEGALCPPKGYDRVHPTAAGYSLMAGVWAGAILPFVPHS
jgi:lysophospholipase L1-like esterase